VCFFPEFSQLYPVCTEEEDMTELENQWKELTVIHVIIRKHVFIL